MFISRVEIDLQNRFKTKDLNHLGSFHNFVESSFPQEKLNKIRTRKLWRIDFLGEKTFLLIVSQSIPDLKILEEYGVEGTAESKNYDNFIKSLEVGKKYLFKTTLNPVKSLSSGKNSGKRGRVVPHVTLKDKMNFILDRSTEWGFMLQMEDFLITEDSFEILKKSHSKPLKLSKVTYEGVLTLTDTGIFKQVLTCGVGREKAYGCGMFTVIPFV